MARLLDFSNYRHGTRNVPIPSPVQEAPRCQATFSKLFETAYGLIIITKLEVGIDPCLFGNSNKFASPVSTREVVEFKKTLALMMPNVFLLVQVHRFLVPWCLYQLKTSDKWEQQRVHKILDQAAEVMHRNSACALSPVVWRPNT